MSQPAVSRGRVRFISATIRTIVHSILLMLGVVLSVPASHADERSETPPPLLTPIVSETAEIPAVAAPYPSLIEVDCGDAKSCQERRRTLVQLLADCPERWGNFRKLSISAFDSDPDIAETYRIGQTPPSIWAYNAVLCLRDDLNATIAAINARFSGQYGQLNALSGYATEQSRRLYRSESDIRTINDALEVIDERIDALENGRKGTLDVGSGANVAIESHRQQFVDLRAYAEPPVIQIFNDLNHQKASQEPVRQQIDPNADVAPLFPHLDQLGFLVATAPDPIVPRLLRSYDESIAALIQGMLSQGYVLDRYAFLWQAKLHQRGMATVAPTNSGQQEQVADDGKFGLMVFRRDLWRGEEKRLRCARSM